VTRRAAALTLTLMAAALPGAAVAQSAGGQPGWYLLTIDASDARSVWLQPAGLSQRRESSLGAHVTAQRVPGDFGVAEYGITLASNGVAFGWHHDGLAGAPEGTAYALGLGTGDSLAGAGISRRWYRSMGRSDGTWDVGARWRPSPGLGISVVWRNIGDFVARDTLPSVVVPAAAFDLAGGRLRFGAEADLMTDGWRRGDIRASLAMVVTGMLRVRLRSTFSRDGTRSETAISVEWRTTRHRAVGFVADDPAGSDLFGVAADVIQRQNARRFPGR